MTTLVLLIGAPRSGTTWLQQVLASHPDVVSPPETELFSRYLAPAVAAWDRSLDRDEASGSPRRLKGLSTVLTAAEFDTWARSLVAVTVERALAAKPGARIVLEKTPGHSRCGPVVERCAPDARYVHLLRDGRDVAASLVAAGRGWGHRWAPTTVGAAATMWRDHVLDARASLVAAGDRGHQIRFEDLRGAAGPGALQAVLGHCGVAVTADEAAALLAARGIEATDQPIRVAGEHAGAAVAEPAGFVRSGATGGWRDEWSAAERAAFAARAGELLVELGYAPDDRWVGTVSPVVRARSVATRFAGRVGRSIGAWAERNREQLP